MLKRRVLVLAGFGLAFFVVFIIAGRKFFLSTPPKYQKDLASKAASIYRTESLALPAPGQESEPGTPSDSQGNSGRREPFRFSERMETARANLYSPDASTRREAAGILNRMGSRKDLDTLAELVTKEQDPRTQIVMIRALGKRSTPESIEALSQCLLTDNPNVQRAVVMSLGRMKNPEARASLREALDGGHIENERVRRLIKRIIDGPFGQRTWTGQSSGQSS